MPRPQRHVSFNERSPLIAPRRKSEDSDVDPRPLSVPSPGDDDSNSDDEFAQSKSSLYLFLLALSIGGLQIVWSVELSNGSPYLLSLGMSKALVAFVWLAGPMTGVLVQPYIGMLSDRCQISWGKRKPFMIAGTLGTVAASLLLAYARQITQLVGRWGDDAPYEGYWKTSTIVMATVLMWVLDFSINAVQAAIRAFIVDGAPAHQQEDANAWASRISGVGNVLGYIFGYLNLPRYIKFLGREQFQGLCALASIVLTSTVLISVLTIKERNPQDDPPPSEDYETGFLAFFKSISQSIKRLPTPIRSVCAIQFCHWMGWFPFLFYITTYIGQLYVNPKLTPGMTPEEVDDLWAQATRVGTFALLLYAIVSVISNVFLPFLVVPTYKSDTLPADGAITPISPITTRTRAVSNNNKSSARPKIIKRSTSTMSASMGGEASAQTAPPFMQRLLGGFRIPGFTLRRAWILAQLLFAGCMFSTFFISSSLGAIIMTSVVGVSWSLTIWAPFALISAEISKRDEVRRTKQRQKLLDGTANSFYNDDDFEEDRAGIILGLHNVAVSAPQVIATLISSAIFKLLQKPRNVPGDVSTAWTLRLAGLAGLAAAYLTWRMEESPTNDDDEE